MKPPTIADLKESSENYKRLYHERKLNFMVEMEANEIEFLTREFELLDSYMHYLDFEKKYNEVDWYSLDDEKVKVLVEGINILGFEKVFYSVKRKMEFIQEQISNLQKPSELNLEQDSVANLISSDAKVEIPFESTKDGKSKSENGSKPLDIIHVAIACYCLEIDLTSSKGKALVRKYLNLVPGDSLYKEKFKISESWFKIVNKKRVDNAKKDDIALAKGLIGKLRDKAAKLTITQLQDMFEKEYNSHYK